MRFSPSKISTFERCPLMFKYRYIEKPDVPELESIEAFMGKRVHEALEKLYRDLRFEKVNSLEEVLEFYSSQWEKNWHDSILIVRKEYGPENYRKMGERCIRDYYNRHKPFRDGITVGLEMKVSIPLDPEGRYSMTGIVDRLSIVDGVYEVHDYKTSSSLPLEEYLKNDRQLSLYALAVKNLFPDAKRVVLVWHYLAFDKDIRVEKSDEELERIRRETLSVIKRIEEAQRNDEFPPNEGPLCEWCEYAGICPRMAHLQRVRDLPADEYQKEDGVSLVNRYVLLKEEEKRISEELERVKAALEEYADRERVENIAGSDALVKIRCYQNLEFPGRNEPEREELERVLKESGVWDEVSTVDIWRFSELFKNGKLTPELMEKVKRLVKLKSVKRFYISPLKRIE